MPRACELVICQLPIHEVNASQKAHPFLTVATGLFYGASHPSFDKKKKHFGLMLC